MSKMGTSRRRTPPAPVSAEPPEGARTAYRGTQKTSKSLFGFKKETKNYPALAHVFRLVNEGSGGVGLAPGGCHGPGTFLRTPNFEREENYSAQS